MKRETDNTSWRKKLDDEGLQYLENYRRAKQDFVTEQREAGSVNFLDELLKKIRTTSKHPEENQEWLEFKANNPSLANEVEAKVQEVLSNIGVPSFLDLTNGIHEVLKQAEPEQRKGISFGLAVSIHLIWKTFYDVRQRHFGNAQISDRQFFWTLGTALETIGRAFRTGDTNVTPKGRVNVELFETVRVVRKHETAKLTHRELKDALEFAGIFVPHEEWLRITLHRGRKRGWL